MDVFTRFKQAIKIREVLLDNEVFQLHYRVTAILLLACAGLVASKQHFGDPIDCITRDDVPPKIMDTYCWIHSTFTLPDACNKTVGLEVAHPCVDKSNSSREDRVYHKYYQWVYFVLFFQACGFYAPHLLWKSWESKLMRTLTVELNFKSPLAGISKNNSEVNQAVKYFLKNSYRHQQYFRYFTICEIINFVNVIIQIYAVDQFLGGTFSTYGLEVLDYVQLDQEIRVDPMVRVFPRMTKCTFHRFGASGDIQRYDALCILPLNIINEKIYIVMWFWFVFLAIITGVWLIFRLATHMKREWRHKVLARRASLVNEKHLYVTVKYLTPGDWFVLSMMCKNMDAQWFRALVSQLAYKIKNSEKSRDSRNGKRLNGRFSPGQEPILDQSDTEPNAKDTITSSESDEDSNHDDQLKGVAVARV